MRVITTKNPKTSGWLARVSRILIFTAGARGFMKMVLMAILGLACVLGLAIEDAGAVEVKKGTFQTGVATGNVAISGVGFQPKAVIFYWTRVTTLDANTTGLRMGYGFATSTPTIVNRGTAWASNDNVITTVTGYRRSETYSIIMLSNGTPTLAGQASVASFDADGFTITWQAAPTSNAYIHYIALGGNDLSALAGTFNLSTATGSQAVTGVGFQPNFLMLMSSYTGAVDTSIDGVAAMFSLGFATGSAARGSTTFTIRDADAAATNPVSQQRTDSVLIGLLPTADPPTQDYLVDFTSFDTNGFTLNKTDAPAASTPVFYLALNGLGFQVGAFNRNTATGSQAVTGVGFMPNLVYLQSFNRAAATTIAANGEISIGASDLVSEGSVWGEHNDPGTDDANNWSTASKVIISRTGAATMDADADLTSFDANGFTLNWTTASATAMQYLYWTVKAPPSFTFSAANYNQAEGNSGTATVTITVNRSGDTSGTHTVQYATSDGSAKTADNDYVAASGTLTFNPTLTSRTFTVTINGDTKDENNETVKLALSNPSAGKVGSPGTATITITNDDTAPNVSFDLSTSTGSELDGKVVIPVSLSQASGKTVTVTYNTTNGTATAPADYTAVSNGTLIFLAAERTKYITVTIINDGAGDAGQTFTVTISSPVNANPVAPTTNTVTITEKYGSTATSCASCHAYPPQDGTRSGATGSVLGSHQSHTPLCSTCHVVPATMTSADFGHRNGNIQLRPGATGIGGGYYDQDNTGTYTALDDTFAQRNSPTTRTCITVFCHGGVTTPQWGVGTLDCLGCHDKAMGARRIITGASGEFGLAWGHKNSTRVGTSPLTAADCGVCHMEGSPTTGKADMVYHQNGYIELRDPDTGTTILGVTGFSGTPGNYTVGTTPFSFAEFSRNLSVTLESDPEWLTIASIQNFCLKCHDTDGANSPASRVTGGTATNPWNVSGVSVVNVDAHFLTSNSSYHPVKGKQNNSYTQGAMMKAPWNMTKTNGNNTQYGYLLSCWDCHALSADTGTIIKSVTAHGAGSTLRGTIMVQGPTLCFTCHASSYGTSTPGHGTGSAFTTGDGNMNDTLIMHNCHNCHASSTTTSRPTRAADVHGFNGTWSNGNTQYAFIRNTTTLTRHSPLSPAGAGATTCVGMLGGGACGNSTRTEVYSPGGVY